MIENEGQVRNIVNQVLEEEGLHNFTKIFEKEHNIFRGSHDNMAVPPSIVENYYTQLETYTRTEINENVGYGKLTEGSVLFIGADGLRTEDNAALSWSSAVFAITGNLTMSGRLQIGPIVGDVNDVWEISKTGNTSYGGMGIIAGDLGLSFAQRLPGKQLWFSTIGAGGNISWWTTEGERIRINDSGGISIGSGYVGTDPGDKNVIIEGKVGVGTTTLTKKFNISGTLDVTGAVTFGSTLNVSNKITATSDIEVDSAGAAKLILDAATGNDSYITLQENNVTHWVFGRDDTDGFFKFCLTTMGTDSRLTINGGTGEVTIPQFLTVVGAIGCGEITITNGNGLNLQEDITFTGATAQNLMKFPDNLPTALDFREAGNSYLKFVSTNGSEGVTIGKALTLSSIAAGVSDYDKFLVSDSGVVKYRTGAELADDIEGNIDHGNMAGLADVGDHNWSATKTTAAWSKSIGSGGDYADWATMIVAMPDLIAHAVTVTIKTGTVLTEECYIRNKNGVTSDGAIIIQAEKYYPGYAAIPTADGSGTGANTMQDTSVFDSDDEYNDCWVTICDGTGTDNPPTQITDTVAADGEIFVASWSGTQPDNTSRYVIVGALIDCEGTQSVGFSLGNNYVHTTLLGIGIMSALLDGLTVVYQNVVAIAGCAVVDSGYPGIEIVGTNEVYIQNCAIVGNNTNDNAIASGINLVGVNACYVLSCGISDNNQSGIMIQSGGWGYISGNFGDSNGTWGTLIKNDARATFVGTECSGSSGNHKYADAHFYDVAIDNDLKGTGAGQFNIYANNDATRDLGLNVWTGAAYKIGYELTAGSNSVQHVFSTHGGEKVRILENGNVGIGTPTPGRQFEISHATNAILSLQSVSTSGSSTIYFGDADDDNVCRQIYTHVDDLLAFYLGSTKKITFDIVKGMILIGDTVNTKMTQGLTINQGANDDEILAFKSSDVAHGVTDYAETDTYGMVKKVAGPDGGVLLWGFTEDVLAIYMAPIATNDNTDKDATGFGPFHVDVYKKNGTGIAGVGANANIASFGTGGSTKWILDRDGDTWQAGAATMDSLILDKTSGKGIKIDTGNPTFGWRDLLGDVFARNTGGTKPSFTAYRDGLWDYQFGVNDEEYFKFHIPHDYVAGTDIHLHVHWSHTSAAVDGGTVTFEYEISYAKGHNQAAFGASVGTTFPGTAATGAGGQYRHMITEVQVSAGTPDGNQIDSDDLEPDGVILLTFTLTANNMTGATPAPFIHFADIHYQSTNIGTKNKINDFYA